jgi:hypothetical protein
MKNWEELEDGGSGRWLYVRRVGPLCWVFIGIDDMVDCCGRDTDFYFSAQVSVVDVLNTPQETVNSALSSCGAESWLHDLPKDQRFLAAAQCMFDYGAKAPCWEGSSPTINKEKNKDWQWSVPSDSSPTFTRLRAAARRFAEENLLDEEKRNELLDTRVVNKLGQTARQFAGGTESLWGTLRRIKEDPNASEEQKLVLRLYQGAGQTLGAGPVPEDIMGGL